MPSLRHPRDDGLCVVEVERHPDERLGAEVRNMVVQSVEEGSPAWKAGICVGMMVQEVDGRRVTSVRELAREIREAGWRFRLTLANSSSVGYALRTQPVRHPPHPSQGVPSRHNDIEAVSCTPTIHETVPRAHIRSHPTIDSLSYTPTVEEVRQTTHRMRSITSSPIRRHPQQVSPELRETLDWGSQYTPSTPRTPPLAVSTHGHGKMTTARLQSPGKRRFHSSYAESRNHIPLNEVGSKPPGRRQIPQFRDGELTQRLVSGEDVQYPYVRTRVRVDGPTEEMSKRDPPPRRVARPWLEESEESVGERFHFQRRYIPHERESYTPTTSEVQQHYGYAPAITDSPIRRRPPSTSPEMYECMTFDV